MGYFPIYRPAEGKPTSATYTGTTVTQIDGYYVLLDKVVTLNAVEWNGITKISGTITYYDENNKQRTYSCDKGELYWIYSTTTLNPANFNKVATTPPPINGLQFRLILYFSSGHIESLSKYTDLAIEYSYSINNYSTSYATAASLKSVFQSRGFSDVAIDLSGSSVKYCRVDAIQDGHLIFMWPVGSTVRLFLSPYFALGRNEDGTVKEGQVPLFETPNVKITNFYRVQFLYGGLSDPYYGSSIPKKSNQGWYIDLPLVGYGSDPFGTWYRLDLTYIQFLFETPFTTDMDIQNYLRRKYLATKTNANSTDQSKYSGYCSMSELATMLGFSDIEHSNSAKSAANTPVKIYEEVVDNQIGYGVCFGRESHDKSSMSGYSNLLEGDESIAFKEVNKRYFRFKDWRWNDSVNDSPGKGSWTLPMINRSFDKSKHFIERARWVNNLSYSNINTQGDSLEAMLRKQGATDISNANSWTYNKTFGCWVGTDRITFKLENYDVIKTGSNTSPENASYSYKDSEGYLTLPVNLLRKINNTEVYCIYLNNFALCRFSRNSFLYNGSSAPNNSWATLTTKANNYQEYSIKTSFTTKEPTIQKTPSDYRIDDQSLYATLLSATINNNKLKTSYSGQYVNEKNGTIDDDNLKYWGQQPLYRASKIGSSSTQNTVTPSGNMAMVDNVRYNLDNKHMLIKCVRTPVFDKENCNTQLLFYINPSTSKYTTTRLTFGNSIGQTTISANFTFYQWDLATGQWKIAGSQLTAYLNDLCFSRSKQCTLRWDATRKNVGYDWMLEKSFMGATINNGGKYEDDADNYQDTLTHLIDVNYQTTVFSNEWATEPSATFSDHYARIPTARSQTLNPPQYPKGDFSNIPFQNNYQVNFQLRCTCSVKWPAGTMVEYLDLMHNHRITLNSRYYIENTVDSQTFTTKSKLYELGNGFLIQTAWAEVYTTPIRNGFDYLSQLTVYYNYCSDSYPDPVNRQDAFFAWKYRTQFYFGTYVYNANASPYYEEYLLIEELA